MGDCGSFPSVLPVSEISISTSFFARIPFRRPLFERCGYAAVVNMNMVLSAYMIPSPLPGAGRTDNDCEAESDIPFVTFPLLRRRNDCTCLKVNWPGVLALRRYITQENCTREESRILIKQIDGAKFV